MNKLSDDWKDLNKIIVFGCGRQGRKMYPTLSKDFDVVAVIDNSPDKQGRNFYDKRIISFDQAEDIINKFKIIITASQYYYKDIREQLISIGLVENKDFVMYQQFVTEWYYKYRDKINVLKTDISLTTLCTLNCENCMQFLPYWESKRRRENSFEEIKQNLDTYFSCVDYLLDLDIVGGEPFLYSRICDFIKFLGENYRDRIGYVGFITNGMIVPNDEVLGLIKKYKIEVSISDYSENIEYNNRIDELCNKLETFGISYMRNKNIDWFDFGFPKDRFHYNDNEVVNHTRVCNSIEHVLDDEKIFYCGLEWSAQKGGLFPIEQKAYVDLKKVKENKVERKEILEMIMGELQDGHLDFCKVCGGFGIDNNNRVETAKQV